MIRKLVVLLEIVLISILMFLIISPSWPPACFSLKADSSQQEFQAASIQKAIMSRFGLGQSVYERGVGYYARIVEEVESESVLTCLCNEFVSGNYLYLDYYVKDELIDYLRNRDQSIKDPDKVVRGFDIYLEKKSEFAAVVTDFFALFIKSKGHEIYGFKEKTKRGFFFEELMRIAVRNIMPLKISDSGSIMYKICVAGEGFTDYPKRNKALEAFSFQTVLNSFKAGELKDIMDGCRDSVKPIIVSTHSETMVKRAQGAYWLFLYNDRRFNKILEEAYRSKNAYLPFEVIFVER